jgi:hypothetical protein
VVLLQTEEQAQLLLSSKLLSAHPLPKAAQHVVSDIKLFQEDVSATIFTHVSWKWWPQTRHALNEALRSALQGYR